MNQILVVKIYSFGFRKSGIPKDSSGHGGGFVFDCRSLPNPGRQEHFKDQTGLDGGVIDYLSASPVVQKFLKHAIEMVDLAVADYTERGFGHLMVSFGCTGGQHRSIFCAEYLHRHLQEKGIVTVLRHVELPEIKLSKKMNQTLRRTPSSSDGSSLNAGVTKSAIRFCDLQCKHAALPKDEGIDGSKSCRTFSALWCNLLGEYVVKNSPCSHQYGKRRPKAGW
ncbi:hypothetical protein JXJ21_14410 [candidate division KSB1 bacterium]|nr:hypothetical protein [candidate division KSB1 bacterium]